ncbi:MAG TPA: bacteriohopanetetrol glucosamine biosynthesis glycosyltransferase HpnI [Geobacteraceae bacterium]|nr:bacteriohopanetetrol glucosamine biosynthesis glycosyltransferase HpnI [Geobacteraceae bacterium]
MLQQILPFIIIAPPALYGLISLYCARDFFSRRESGNACLPPVTILKPVKGTDAESFKNFASFCTQDYPLYQIVFAAASPDDPVISVIKNLIERYPGVDIELVVDGRIYGANYKVCNLINAFPKAKYDILIVCDSDIRVNPNYLREVCSGFSDPSVGLVTSLYRSREIRGIATALEALGFTAEMVPNVMVALKLEGLSFGLGASMAVRREALEKIGGFPALVDYLADDYQLGNMVHRAGYRLALSGHFVESVMKRERLPGILSRQLRWARTMRVSRPAGYFASGITQPVPMALLALIASGFSPAGWLAFVLLGLTRVIVVFCYSRFFVGDRLVPRYAWLLPVRDCLAFGTWALSFLGNRVTWRGNRFRLLPGGKIIEIDN